jgi:hypothetical protein
VTALAGGNIVTVAWTASTVPTGGSPFTGDQVVGLGSTHPCVTGLTITTCTATFPAKLPTGASGTTYSVKVRALTAINKGAWSSSVSVLFGVPAAPASVTAVAGNAQATVSWTPGHPASHAVSQYT